MTSSPDSSPAPEPEEQAQATQQEEPAKLPDCVSIIEDGDRLVYLVGTAHVSKKSVEEVEAVIDQVDPDSIVVELCQARLDALDNPDRWQNTNVYKIVKEGKGMVLLANLMLTSFQKKLGDKLGVKPGSEMMKAVELARSKDKNLVLGDRNIQVTLKRTWAGLSMFEKSKIMAMMFGSLFVPAKDIDEDELEKMKDKDMLNEILAEAGKSFPAITERLIHERDLYLMNSISGASGKKVVAILGAGHCPGITKHWREDVDLAALTHVPKGGYFLKCLKWSIPLIMIAVIIAFFFKNTEDGMDVMKTWVIINGICAGIGALLALGHPLTIISAVLAAPFTSLNPLIAAGWVAGLVEAIIRKPKVSDCQTLQEDVTSVRGFYRNGITRVLLVVALSNLGSAIGTWIATGGIFVRYIWDPLKTFLTGS